MAEVLLEDVTKVFRDGTRAVDGLDLRVSDGEFMVLVGPSGCGKTTALRMVAGLEEISDGVIRIGSRAVNDVSPKKRDIAMVFQSYALYPHLSVYDNIAFPLKLAKVPRNEIQRRVQSAAKTLDLDPYLSRKPRALSGGQRQRVAMGRAIVREPSAFLMDEPLSNLDAKLRVQMRADIKKLQSDLEVTTIYVTHDQVEAMTMGDRVAVLRQGQLQQVGPPEELYDAPVNMFVAGFIGSPAMNMFEARIERRGDSLVVVAGDAAIELDDRHGFLEPWSGRDIVLGVRPEDLEDGALAPPDQPRLQASVQLREALGSEVLVHFMISARPAETEEMRELAEDAGIDHPVGEHAAVIGRFSARSRVAVGDQIEVALDSRQLHFFDPRTGGAIR